MTTVYLGEKTGLISRQLFAVCSQEALTCFSMDVGPLYGSVIFVLVHPYPKVNFLCSGRF